eukprot:11157547-Lingulodinium_polyedra.AAC.1
MLHIAIATFRNDFDLIHARFASFIADRLVLHNDSCNHGEVYNFWTALWVEPDVATILADPNLHWASGRLAA